MQTVKFQIFAPQMPPPAKCHPGRPPSFAPSRRHCIYTSEPSWTYRKSYTGHRCSHDRITFLIRGGDSVCHPPRHQHYRTTALTTPTAGGSLSVRSRRRLTCTARRVATKSHHRAIKRSDGTAWPFVFTGTAGSHR